MSLAAGSCVLINGLRTQAVYNGRYGVVCGATEGGRLTVRLQEGGHSINVKPDNLQKVCSGCRQVKDRLSACSRCKSAFFCGKDCMRAAWPEHKKECGKQPWLVNGPSLEQEIDDARLAFDRDDSDDAVAIRANEFLGRMRCLRRLETTPELWLPGRRPFGHSAACGRSRTDACTVTLGKKCWMASLMARARCGTC